MPRNPQLEMPLARPPRKRGGLPRDVCSALLDDLRRDAMRVAERFELPPFVLDADRPGATDRYGICHDDGRILVRLCHATTGRPLRYSALVDTVVHELAHLRHRDHGPRWEALYQRMLEWCRQEGLYRPRPVTPSRGPAPPAARQLALLPDG